MNCSTGIRNNICKWVGEQDQCKIIDKTKYVDALEKAVSNASVSIRSQGYASGPSQRPAQGYAPGPSQRPAQGYAPGPSQRPAQGYAPGPSQIQTQGYAPGPSQRQAPAYNMYDEDEEDEEDEDEEEEVQSKCKIPYAPDMPELPDIYDTPTLTPDTMYANIIDILKSSRKQTTTNDKKQPNVKKMTIPQETNIGMYINAFLDIDGNSSTYLSSGWEDTYNPSTIEFKFSNGIPPRVLSTAGFPTKTITLLGPSSENISCSTKILGSFTFSFYMNFINNINFIMDSYGNIIDIELLQIYMQTPYYTIFYITQDTANPINVNINALVGNSMYTWNIAISTLVTGHMFTFVVDTSQNANTPLITFYINSININITTPPEIIEPTKKYVHNLILGVSQVIINKGGYLDTNLWAFVYYNSILSQTDISSLYNYFNQQHNGNANLQSLLANQADNSNAAANDISDLENKLLQLTKTVNSKIKSCANNNKPPVQQKPKWNIRAGPAELSTVPYNELAQCSPLEVYKFGQKSNNQKQIKTQNTNTNNTNDTNTEFNNKFNIKNPSNSISSLVKNDTKSTAQAYVSSSTPNYANPNSSSYDFNSIKDGLFSYFS